MLFNIAYENKGITKLYCMEWADLPTMLKQLENFHRLYGNGKEDIRAYPNGKGFYAFTNVRIISDE